LILRGFVFGALFLVVGLSDAQTDPSVIAKHKPNLCPSDMVRVRNYCIDRFEVSTRDLSTKQLLSPYYPPLPGYVAKVLDVWQVERFEWGSEAARSFPLPELSRFQIAERYEPTAISVGGRIPQSYLSRELSRRICKNAGKRLCSYEQWQTACRGERGTVFPYGNEYVEGRCNVWRAIHPARVLHGNASMGHLDPRLNLLVEVPSGDPLLRETGATKTCASHWGSDAIYDMVGNLDEWVDDDPGMFVGGFYSRNTSKGCDAKVSNHAPTYFDYSTGTRCCKDLE
jgi:hypothetical protein